MLNKIELIGRVVAPPELKTTAKGNPICSFRFAVSRDTKNSAGEYPTDFFDIVAFNKQAELLEKAATKGRLMYICGRLNISEFEDKHKEKRKSYSIFLNSFYFLSKRPEEEKPKKTEPDINIADDDGFPLIDDDDLPF